MMTLHLGFTSWAGFSMFSMLISCIRSLWKSPKSRPPRAASHSSQVQSVKRKSSIITTSNTLAVRRNISLIISRDAGSE